LINEKEMDLIDKMIECRKVLERNDMMSAQWEFLETVGPTPGSREGCSGIVIGNHLYLYGGFSRDLYNDMRKIDLTRERRWFLF
jgi:hypothetical protein